MEGFFYGFAIGLVGGGVMIRLYAQRLINKAKTEVEDIRAKAGEAIRKVTGGRQS